MRGWSAGHVFLGPNEDSLGRITSVHRAPPMKTRADCHRVSPGWSRPPPARCKPRPSLEVVRSSPSGTQAEFLSLPAWEPRAGASVSIVNCWARSGGQAGALQLVQTSHINLLCFALLSRASSAGHPFVRFLNLSLANGPERGLQSKRVDRTGAEHNSRFRPGVAFLVRDDRPRSACLRG
jgi:hypothetical protein